MYDIHGITGRGSLPGIADQYSGPVLILGGAACVWSDIAGALRLFDVQFNNDRKLETPCGVIAVNDIGCYFRPRLDHMVSHHEDHLDPTIRLRVPHACDLHLVQTHTQIHKVKRRPTFEPAMWEWNFSQGVGGTSSMLAVMVALALGYSRVILCGIPIDGTPHFFDPPWQALKMFDGSTQRFEWNFAKNWMAGRVRSMSGRTAEWLGYPNKEWLDHGE